MTMCSVRAKMCSCCLSTLVYVYYVCVCVCMLFGHALCEQANDRKKIMFHK